MVIIVVAKDIMVMEIITKIDIQTGLKIVVKVVLTRTNLIIQKFVLTVKPLTLTMQNFVINVVYHFQRTVSNAIPHWQVVPDFAANAEQQLALNSRGLLGLNNMAISFESALGDHGYFCPSPKNVKQSTSCCERIARRCEELVPSGEVVGMYYLLQLKLNVF